MSTLAASPALTSRVTPRSPKKWKSPKSYPGPTNRSSRHKAASANFGNPPLSPPYRSPRKKGAYSPGANPKALIERLSPSTYTRSRRAPEPPPSPTKLLDKLLQSKSLSAMLSSGKDVLMEENHVKNHSAPSAADNVDATEEGPLVKAIQDIEQEDPQPISPMSTTSAADVDEILRAADSDQVDSGMPTAIPNSPIDGQAVFPATVSLYERCRRLILPLAMQNARARDTAVDTAVGSQRLEQHVMTLMTDEYCADSVNMAKDMKEQMAALKTDTDGNVESIVGVKRRREDEDTTKDVTTSRVRLTSEEFESAKTNKSLPQPPKAIAQTKQNDVLDTSMSIGPHSDNNVPLSPTRTTGDTPLLPVSQPEIPIPMELKYFRRPTPDRRDSNYAMETDRSGRQRAQEDNNRDIELRRDPSYDQDKPERRWRDGDDKSRDAKLDRRHSRYSDRDMDRSKRGRRGSGDDGTWQIDSSRNDSRCADWDLDTLERRRRDRSDKEWDYVRTRRGSGSGSRKYSSSGSSRRHSHEPLASRISGPSISTPPKTVTREPLSTGPGCRVPGLWFVKVGLDHMDVVNMTFEVDDEVASRCRRENGSRIAVRLVCLPTASVQETYKKLDPAAPPEVVTDAMRHIKPEWPPKGTIIIEVNPGDKIGRSWLPHDLDPATALLELTVHIRPGQNSIRLIHLGDLSSHTFLLHAAESNPSSPPAETPTPTLVSTKDLVDFDWKNYVARLQANATKHSHSAFKFAGTVDVEAQTV